MPKAKNQPSIPPNILKHAHNLNQQGIRRGLFPGQRRFTANGFGFGGTVAGGSPSLTPTPLPEGEGLKMAFSIKSRSFPRLYFQMGKNIWKQSHLKT